MIRFNKNIIEAIAMANGLNAKETAEKFKIAASNLDNPDYRYLLNFYNNCVKEWNIRHPFSRSVPVINF